MKRKILLFTIIIFFLGGKTNAQIYQGFPTIGGYWKVEYGNISCVDIHGVSDVCSEYQYVVTGDTLINAELYRKINLSGHDRNPIDETWTYWNSGYHACYRNDLINKKVYFIPKDSLYEILLYDFNLSLNDTLPDTYIYNKDENYIVTIDQIDSIQLPDIYLKRYHLSENAGFGGKYLIEGIGSTFGLFSPIELFFEQHYDLLCFKNYQENLYYFKNDSTDCDLITNISKVSQEIDRIKIYPNPVNDYLIIDNSLFGENLFVEIFNNTGQRIKTINNVKSRLSLNLSNLKSGLFLVRISSDSVQIKTRKIVKE
ncbi:MAG: T9SS type A sorting domain-containing protein [Bacteroidales bacterium]|nr:T9SS type A sorting domain-containing protein [Bacteroidales bacterium]